MSRTADEVEEIPSDTLVKSPQDRRQYRRLRLPNGVRVVLIQREPDPDQDDCGSSCSSEDSGSEPAGDTRPAALALGVTVGHFYDPPEHPGLAHLLEHMLFMDRAPNENGWEQFLSEHGGWSNATTSEETTLYYYEIHPDYLLESIERFVKLFLLDPPLCLEAIDREIQAVEAEFQEGRLVDEHRQTQVLCHLAQPGHPLRHFGWGNLRSLSGEAGARTPPAAVLADPLRRFHADHYRAENLNLVVMVGGDLDQVQDQIRVQFGAVHVGARPKMLASTGLPLTLNDAELGMVQVTPIKETYSLEVVFQLPCLQTEYDRQPCGYWGEVLGDEGPGSAAQILRQRGLASDLKAGLSHEQTYQNSLFFLFTIEITLTKAGYTDLVEVLRLVFAYINVCVSAGPQPHLWDQYATMASASFTWAEPKEPAETVEDVAYAMQRYAWDDLLSGPYLWRQYDPDRIMAVGEQLRPDNALILVLASGASCKSDSDPAEAASTKSAADALLGAPGAVEVEPWFGTEFRRRAPSPPLLQALRDAHDPALSLPKPSSLLPRAFTLVQRPTALRTAPSVAGRTSRARVWHLAEPRHVTPRANLTLRFYTGACYRTPRAAVTTRLLVMLLEDGLSPYLYEGEVADLSLSLRADRRALELQADGFADRLFDFVEQVVCRHPDGLGRLVVRPDRFTFVKERLQIAWKSAFFTPTDQASYERLRVLQSPKFSIEELRAALDQTQLDDVIATLEAIRATAFIDVLLHGNASVADATRFAETLTGAWGPPCSSSPDAAQTVAAVRLLPPGTMATWTRPSFNPLERNSAHVSYYQFGADSVADRARLRFLQRISCENGFDSLRTRSQLGYSVTVQYVNTDGVLGLAVEIVSSTHTPSECETAIEAWISDELYPLIMSMPDDTFENHIEGFIMDIEAQDFSLSAKHDRLWDEIATHTYVFDRVEQETAIIEQIQRSDLITVMDLLFQPASRSKLATHVVGQSGVGSGTALSFSESMAWFSTLPTRSRTVDLPDVASL